MLRITIMPLKYNPNLSQLTGGDISYARKYWTIHRINDSFYIGNTVIAEETLLDRLRNFYIPPAYNSHFYFAKSINNPIQVITKDSKGRSQYLYKKDYLEKQSVEKFKEVLNLGNLSCKIEHDTLLHLKEIARKENFTLVDKYYIIIYMLIVYNFRIGNHIYLKQNNTYGITTLLRKHIDFHNDNHFIIEFVGKKNIINRIEDNNPTIYKILYNLSRDLNKDDHLFTFLNKKSETSQLITPDMVQYFINQTYNANISCKMFRTWYANIYLLAELKRYYDRGDIILKDNRSLSSAIKNAFKYVAFRLHNTPLISKKSYLNNKVLNHIINHPRIITYIPLNYCDLHQFLYKLTIRL